MAISCFFVWEERSEWLVETRVYVPLIIILLQRVGVSKCSIFSH